MSIYRIFQSQRTGNKSGNANKKSFLSMAKDAHIHKSLNTYIYTRYFHMYLWQHPFVITRFRCIFWYVSNLSYCLLYKNEFIFNSYPNPTDISLAYTHIHTSIPLCVIYPKPKPTHIGGALLPGRPIHFSTFSHADCVEIIYIKE